VHAAHTLPTYSNGSLLLHHQKNNINNHDACYCCVVVPCSPVLSQLLNGVLNTLKLLLLASRPAPTHTVDKVSRFPAAAGSCSFIYFSM
jgi:hypothetical protein